MNEEPALDSAQKIGTVKGVDYYYATGTGAALAMLFNLSRESQENPSYFPYTKNSVMSRPLFEKVKSQQMVINVIQTE